VFVTWKVTEGTMPLLAVALAGMKPESNGVVAAASSVQGAVKLDCVTVWLPVRNWNWTMSPWVALRLLGMNVCVSFQPTITVWVV